MVNFSKETLIEICEKESLKYLDNLMEKEWPRSAPLKCWLQVRRKWKEQFGVPFYVFCPEGDVQNGFVCFGKVGGVLRHVILYQESTKQWDKLFQGLKATNLITWTPSLQFGVPNDKYDKFLEVVEERKYQVFHRNPTFYYTLPEKAALSFDVNFPQGLFVDRLKSSHIKLIVSNWPLAFKEAEEYLECLISWNFGYGVFSKKDPSQPLSWCVLYEIGDLGVLQTREGYKKIGLAHMLMQEMSKIIAGKDLPNYLYVIIGNKPSENLVKKMGYTAVGSYDWPDIIPVEESGN